MAPKQVSQYVCAVSCALCCAVLRGPLEAHLNTAIPAAHACSAVFFHNS